MNVWTMAWLLRDYAAMGSGAIRVDDRQISLHVGRRFDFAVPLSSVDSILKPEWKDIPQTGMPEAKEFIKLMSHPNVLIRLKEPVSVPLPLKRTKNVNRIGLQLDEPEPFIDMVRSQIKNNG